MLQNVSNFFSELLIFVLAGTGFLLTLFFPPLFVPQGILDIIVLSRDDIKQELVIHALKNNFEADAYFVKVIGKWVTRKTF